MVLIFPRAFNVAPPLTITPFRAHAAARPATYVTGVLIVKAHGQASENYDQTIHRPEMTSVITDQPRTRSTYRLPKEGRMECNVVQSYSTNNSVRDRFAAGASSTNQIKRETAKSCTGCLKAL